MFFSLQLCCVYFSAGNYSDCVRNGQSKNTLYTYRCPLQILLQSLAYVGRQSNVIPAAAAMYILAQVIIVIVSRINNLKTALYGVHYKYFCRAWLRKRCKCSLACSCSLFILAQVIIVIMSGMNSLKIALYAYTCRWVYY